MTKRPAIKSVYSITHTLWRVHVSEIRLCSEHNLLQDDSEAVDVTLLSSVDRSSCHTQQLRCCPQLIEVIVKLAHLHITGIRNHRHSQLIHYSRHCKLSRTPVGRQITAA